MSDTHPLQTEKHEYLIAQVLKWDLVIIWDFFSYCFWTNWMSAVEGQIKDMRHMKEKEKNKRQRLKLKQMESVWKYAAQREKDINQGLVQKKDERGKFYKKRREKPHSRDKCPHHGLEDCITFLQHSSRP